ncbi:MAG: glycoside hydrolase family 3 C-terminal domain-containing protein [Gemmatimonadota bacterium]
MNRIRCAPKLCAPTLLLGVLLVFPFPVRGQEPRPYQDPGLSTEARVQDLVARMTLEEKTSMMSNATPGVPRLGIPRYDWWSEALHGVANAGYATVFPQAIGLAAMWDDSLHQEIAHVIGVEARAKFNGYVGTPLEGAIFRGLTFWSPNINIFRDPRWGRGQETYGEDPYLTGRLGVAFVRGLQGDHPDYLLAAAGAKHFAVHSGPEPLRHDFDAAPPERDLHETYLPAFEEVVREGDVEIVMTAYNAVYGVPASISPLLYGLLDAWDFDGHVTSDCGSVSDLHQTYGVAADGAEANAMTLKAGMNVRCGGESANLLEAVRRGLVTEAEIDEGLAPLIRTMLRLGFFDPEDRVPFNGIAPSVNTRPEHGALALRAARESMVLLKNDGLLPLDTKRLRRVAVVGPNATSVPALVGNYNGTPYAPVTVLDGLKAALEPAGVEVTYVHGSDYAARPTETRTITSGWFQGEYFANPTLSGEPAARRTERPLDFDFGSGRRFGGLPAGVPDGAMSARWSGHLQTTLGGDYELVVRGRGGFRLLVDGEAVIDSWTPPPGQAGEVREVRVTRALPDNASLPLRLEYVQGDGPVRVAVEWNTPPVDSGIDDAVAAAQDADVIVYVGGISGQLEGEAMAVDYEGFVGGDRRSIELPPLQQELLERLRATGRPIVLVDMSGSAMALAWADANVDAILQAWYPGQAGGTAVADVLVGTYNPAGRLPVTFYGSTEDLPPFESYAMAGRTYRYFEGEPLYPFGHGLSYTTFDYGDLRADRETWAAADTLTVRVDVTNTGDRAGDEVVQLYVAHPQSTVERPLKELKGFERITLDPGETRTVEFALDARALAYWDAEDDRWVVEAAPVEVQVGASSTDIRRRMVVPVAN